MKPARYKTLEDLESVFSQDMLGWMVSIEEPIAAFFGDECEFKGKKYSKLKLNGHVLGCIEKGHDLKTGDVIKLKLAAVGLTSTNGMYLLVKDYKYQNNLCEVK